MQYCNGTKGEERERRRKGRIMEIYRVPHIFNSILRTASGATPKTFSVLGCSTGSSQNRIEDMGDSIDWL